MDMSKPASSFLLLPLQAELIGRLKWLVQLRWIAIAGVSCTILATRYIFRFDNLLIIPLFVLVLFTAGLNVTYSLYLSKSFPKTTAQDETDLKRAQTFAITQICFDLVLLTLMIHYAGGVENPFSIFYIFHVIISSILLNRRHSIAIALFVVILYSGMILGEYFGIIAHYSLIGLKISYRYLFGVIFAFGAAMLISAWSASSIRMQLRKREDELEKARGALELLEAQKSDFLKTVAHELRSPITAIQGSLALVENLMGETLEDNLKRSISRSMIRAAEVVQLSRDLLEFSRLTSLKHGSDDMMDVDLVNVAKSVVEGYGEQVERKKICFETFFPDAPLFARCDPRSVEQILSNLISNAIRYTPEKGRIKVELEKAGQNARLTVTDSGIGISPEELNCIGMEFYRSPRAKQFEPAGTGMGMKIVKEALKQHNGSMKIESEMDKGATMRVDIPLSPPHDIEKSDVSTESLLRE